MRNWRLDEDEEGEDGARKPDMPMTAGPVQNGLYKSRTVLIFGEIDMRLAERVTAQLLALSNDSDADIRVIVNSPGGHVESGDTIHDMITFCGPKVKMIGTGWVASAGAHIYLGAKKENRLCLPNTRFLLHQPSGGTRGMASDIEIQAREILKLRQRLNEIYVKHTGQPLEAIHEALERDNFMTAEGAKTFGLVDDVITSRAALEAAAG